jgi:hypothetical protein
MKVIATVHTTVPMEIEVDDKFQPLTQWEALPDEEEEQLSSELLLAAAKALPETGYYQEISSVESLDGDTMAEW